MARVLIAGCGYVGSALARMLADEGHSVWGLRRNIEDLPDGVYGIEADLTDPRSLLKLPQGLEFMFYCASADSRSDADYAAAYSQGLENVLEALDDQGSPLRRAFFTSSTAVYGQTEGEWVDEGSDTDPLHFTGVRMLEAESIIMSGPFPATVVRFGGIYGPGRTRLLRQVYQGEAQVPSRPVFTNRVHREDCAGILVHLMEMVHPQRLYLGVDHEPASLTDVLSWMSEQLGVDLAERSEGTGGGSRNVRRTSKRCRNGRVCATGYQFRFASFRDGYVPMISRVLRQH